MVGGFVLFVTVVASGSHVFAAEMSAAASVDPVGAKFSCEDGKLGGKTLAMETEGGPVDGV